MDIQVLSLMFNAIQTLIITISLGLLIYQLKQFNQNLQQDAYTKLADYSMKINELVLQGKPLADQLYQHHTDYLELSNDQKDLYLYLALIFGLCERLYLLFIMKGINRKTWAAWERWLTEAIFPLDVFETFWQIERTWYHEDFSNYIDRSFKIYKSQINQDHPLTSD